jgi:hypothetical protein
LEEERRPSQTLRISPYNRRSSLEDEFERAEIEDELEEEHSLPRVHFSDENGRQMVSPQ